MHLHYRLTIIHKNWSCQIAAVHLVIFCLMGRGNHPKIYLQKIYSYFPFPFTILIDPQSQSQSHPSRLTNNISTYI